MNTYRASIVIVNEHRQVVARRDGAAIYLPQVEVEHGRVGISVFRAIRDQLHLKTFALVLPNTSDDQLNILRLQSSDAHLPSGCFWTEPMHVAEYEQIWKALANFFPSDTEFGRYAWYSELIAWLQEQMAALGFLVKNLEQWNGRPGGVLLRVTTDGPDFWLKAVSDFNIREFSIAQSLAERHAKYFPSILAAAPPWNAFLLEDVKGNELHECNDLSTWIRVAELLAKVQMEWVGKSDKLLNAGAADLRASALVSKIPAFLEHVAEAMDRQERSSPAILIKPDLEELGEQLHELCARVSSFPFSNGLANADFSPHNTILTARGPVFIDWAEACVSLPLITGEYMWNRMVVEAPNRASWQDTLRKRYLTVWANRYGKEPIEDISRLLPAFSVFAVAVFYHEREANGPSPYDAYLRSLARRLQRELRQLQFESCATQSS